MASAHATEVFQSDSDSYLQKSAKFCKHRDQYRRDRGNHKRDYQLMRKSHINQQHINCAVFKQKQIPSDSEEILFGQKEGRCLAYKPSDTTTTSRRRRRRGRRRGRPRDNDEEIEQRSEQTKPSFTCASQPFSYTMLPFNNDPKTTWSKPTRPLPTTKPAAIKTTIQSSLAITCSVIVLFIISSLLATSMLATCQQATEFGNKNQISNHQHRSKAINREDFDHLKIKPYFTTTTETSQTLIDEEIESLASSRNMKIGSKVNKSLMMLDKSQPNDDPKVNTMRRLLVRQLANLIMNNEPETIAQNMAGAKVSGQMVSESGLELNQNSNLDQSNGEQVNSETLLDAGHASMVMDSDLTTLSFDNIGNNFSGDNSPSSSSSSSSSSSYDDQTMTANSNNDGQDNYSSISSNSGSGVEEQFVTCPPDYEDQSMIEVASSNGNLTIEQQQQLLAGADSSGLLSPSSNLTTNINDTSSSSIRQSIGGGSNQQCVHPGNRMIEVITKIITPILFSIIIVVGLVGNIVVMLVILEDRKTERELTPTNLLILDLSLADLSFIIFCIPFTGWDYSVGHWVFGLLWCKFNQYLIVVCALSSIYTLVLMSVDRFMAIVYPIECISYRTSKNTLYAIYIKWIVILLMASPTIQMHGLIDLPLGPDQYTCRFLTDQFNPLHFQIIFFITSYLFPLILIFCLYFSLLNKLWFGSKPHGHKESLKMLESKKKVTWLVAGIVVVFALCWCPIQVMLILMRLKSHKITATYVAIQVFAHTLGYMNSCVNPIVYAFASETFHNSFKKSHLGRICCACSSSSANNNSSTHHQNNNELDRTITGRTTHNINYNNHNYNTTSLNHTNISPQHHHHHHHQQQQQEQQLNHMPISLHSNGKDSSNYMSNDNHVSTTTLLMTPYNSTNNSNDNKIINPPLEPRDRSITPVSIGQSSITKTVSSSDREGVNLRQKTPLIPRQATISSSGCSSINKPAAKQQLVARVAQSGNQVSHICEPCYDQDMAS